MGQLTDLDLPPGSFDGVNLDGVLIYITEPRRLIRHIAGLLRPGGVCRIREYNPDSLRARVAGRRYWVYGPTHPNLWTPRSIRALADAADLRLLRIFPGSEASLARWLASRREPTLLTGPATPWPSGCDGDGYSASASAGHRLLPAEAGKLTGRSKVGIGTMKRLIQKLAGKLGYKIERLADVAVPGSTCSIW